MADMDDIRNIDVVESNVEGGIEKSKATSTRGSSYGHVNDMVSWLNEFQRVMILTLELDFILDV